nr:nuclear cap binding protein subunit 1 [Hymenolepis microstoma]
MSRKRTRDSSFDDDYTFYSKRGRPDRDTVESLVYRIGSKDLDKIHKDVNDLSILFCSDLDKNVDSRVRVITTCARDIPERMEIYTTLLGLINLKNHDFVMNVINAIIRELKDALKACRFDDVKYLVRFLSNSVNGNIIHPGSLLSLYESFVEVTLDVSSSSQCRMDWYCYVVLSSLPYSAKRLHEHNTAALDAILSTISVYLSKRNTHHVTMLRVWETSDPHPQEDYLICLWTQITAMQKANWRENVLWRISDAFPALREIGQPCEFGMVTPPDYDPDVVYPHPQVVFRMFDYTDVYSAEEEEEVGASMPTSSTSRSLPGAHTIERFLVDEQIHVILETMQFSRTMCSKALLSLQTRAKLALEYMIVEAIFADIFRLPKPPVRHGNLLFYSTLLIQLCNDAMNTMPLVLAQATETLFDRLDSMKPACITRFVEWFSFHLINYQLKWSWKDWSRALEEPVMSPRRWFISETLARLVRYSYFENVKQHLPRSFHCLLPPKPGPVNPYDDALLSPSRITFLTIILEFLWQETFFSATPIKSNRTAAQKGEDMGESDIHVRRRSRSLSDTDGSPEHPTESCENDTEGGKNEEMDKDEPLAQCLIPGVSSLELELFMAALLLRAHKTISHTYSLLSRYVDVFRALASTVDLQIEALHILQVVWYDQSQMVVAISNYMSREGMLDPESIVLWAFSPSMSAFTNDPDFNPPSSVHIRPQLLQSHVWECLMHTLIRVSQRVVQVSSGLEDVKDGMGSSRRRSRSRSRSDGSSSEDEHGDTDLRKKINRGRRHHHRDRSYQFRSRSHDSSDDGVRRPNVSPDRLAHMEEVRGEALRSQLSVITLLLHRNMRLINDVSNEMEKMESLGESQTVMRNLESVAFWIKGRLMQSVLEHQDQLYPYMDTLEIEMSDLSPFMKDLFRSLRSLYE